MYNINYDKINNHINEQDLKKIAKDFEEKFSKFYLTRCSGHSVSEAILAYCETNSYEIEIIGELISFLPLLKQRINQEFSRKKAPVVSEEEW